MSEIEKHPASYVVHFFLGRAASEEQKLARWPQWEQCYEAFDEILKEFGKKANVSSDQAYVIELKPYKSDPPGSRRCTYKNVPGVARLPWTREANQHWSTTLDALDSHPVELLRTRIASSKIGIPKGDGRGKEIPEICIMLANQKPVSEGAVYNQSLMLAVSEGYYATRTQAFWDALIARLSTLVSAVRVGRTICPWSQGVRQGNALISTCVAHENFATGTLDFAGYFYRWEYLL